MGPLINARQRDRVLEYIDKGKREGARILLGGGMPKHLDKGYYIEPTVFMDVTNEMVIAREEIFGPVLVVIDYETEDEAINIANNSPYGLSAGVWSGSEEKALAVARRLRTGTVTVNGVITMVRMRLLVVISKVESVVKWGGKASKNILKQKPLP